MFTNLGIAVDAWVKIDGDCALTCDVADGETQLMFGHRSGSLTLLTNENALGRLVRVAGEALRRLQAMPVGAEACFTVTASDNASDEADRG
jgi:hypothetical protein